MNFDKIKINKYQQVMNKKYVKYEITWAICWTVESGIDDSKAEIDSESIKDRVEQESMIMYNNYLK